MTKTTAPTKAEELKVLDVAVATLGPNSYLGPFLRQARAEVEQAIRSDIFPTISLDDARQQGERIIAEAQRQADLLVRQAQATRDRADRAVDEQKAEAARAIAQASLTLTRLATSLSPRT